MTGTFCDKDLPRYCREHDDDCECIECFPDREEESVLTVSDGTEWPDHDEDYVKAYADDIANQEKDSVHVYLDGELIYTVEPGQ